MSDEQVISRITIERYLTDDHDLVRIVTDDMAGNDLAVVEALGLLQLAIYDVAHRPAGENEESA